MLPVQVDHRLLRDQAHPDEERLRVVAEGLQPLVRFDVRLLHDVLGVEAADQPRVEPEVHHARQPFAVVFEQRRHDRIVAGAQLLLEFVVTGFHRQEP